MRENAVADNGIVEAIRERYRTAAALMHSSLIEGSQSGMQPCIVNRTRQLRARCRCGAELLDRFVGTTHYLFALAAELRD